MTFIDAAAPIATHAALTTDVHGTGAGNVVVGDDELTVYSKSSSGSYTGNDAIGRAIPHGLGAKPKLVILRNSLGDRTILMKDAVVDYLKETDQDVNTVTVFDTTNFYVGGSTGSRAQTANANAILYHWVAFI